MQKPTLRALMFNEGLIAVNLSVAGIMLVKMFADLLFETWVPSRIISQ